MPAFLFGFVLLAALRSLVEGFGAVPPDLWQSVLSSAAWGARWLVLIAMAGIGLNTRLSTLRGIGGKPFLAGCFGAVFLAALSFTLIRGF